MFTIEMLPAERGDCLWVRWGDAGEHVMLIDGGPSKTIPALVPELERRIKELPGRDDRVELLVQTHIDLDHIEGLVSLLSGPERVRLFRDIWFNGRHHLVATLGPKEGELITAMLAEEPDRWNRAFDGGAVVVPDAPEPLPVVELAGGMRLTLLAPTSDALAKLAPEWDKWAAKFTEVPKVPKKWERVDVLGAFDPELMAKAPFKEDRSAPNGAGIAFIAEYANRRGLFAADVPPRFLLAAFERLPAHMRLKSGDHKGRVKLDAVKMSHHGSRNNTSLELCQAISCPRWLVSTNGARFSHPHIEALSRVIVSQRRPTFVLNYVTQFVDDIMDGDGDRWRVVTPRKIRGGGYEEGVLLRLIP